MAIIRGIPQKDGLRGWQLTVQEKRRQLTGIHFNSRTTDPPAKGISKIDYYGNFEDFLNSRTDDKPFCFWYGSTEPHRNYEYGSGVSKGGKQTGDIVAVPAFWPDNEIIRNDMLDYAFEIEYFDNHLVKMLDLLEKKGELENTIVIVTADNGMPFPRVERTGIRVLKPLASGNYVGQRH